jgi:hypothetical protein
MGVQEDFREGMRTLTKPVQDYAAMLDAYDTAFGTEKEDYPEQPEIAMDEDDIDADTPFRELLGEMYDSFNMADPIRFYGDTFRAAFDGDREDLREQITEYGGDGVRGCLFTFLDMEERYDVSGAVIGEPPEQVEDAVAPLVEEYHAIPEEQYGVQLSEQRLTDGHEDRIDAAMDVLSPLITAYRDGDVVDVVAALDDVQERADDYFGGPVEQDDVDPIDIGPLVHDDDAALDELQDEIDGD